VEQETTISLFFGRKRMLSSIEMMEGEMPKH